MRVVQVVLGLEVGGLEFVALEIATRADRRRFEHSVVSLTRPGALAPRFAAEGIPVVALNASGRVEAIYRLARQLRRLRADVVHTHNPQPHLIGAFARLAARVPVLVHTKHGRNYPGVPRAVLASRLASTLSDAVVAVSDDAAQVAREVERISPGSLRIIHNGIDTARWRAATRSPDAAPTAVCVARLHAVKDHATLLRAVARVHAVRPDFGLALVGDGPERSALEALTAELGLGGAVAFHGQLDDVRPSVLACDMFVLASISEGIPLTILEAMAASLPVVATDVGGNREVVIPDRTGYLVPSGSPDALAAAMLRLVEDPELARRLGRAGRQRVEDAFDTSRMVADYQSLYLDLLQHRAHRRFVEVGAGAPVEELQ